MLPLNLLLTVTVSLYGLSNSQLSEDFVNYFCDRNSDGQDTRLEDQFYNLIPELNPNFEGHIPWVVTLQDNRYETPQPFCGGVIVDAVWVLTTAFCVHGYLPRHLQVIAGDEDLSEVEGWEQLVGVEEIVVHEAFDSFTQDHDVALLRVWPPFRPTWRVAAMPLKLSARSRKYLQANCVTHGWGMIETSGVVSPTLRATNVTIIRGNECRKSYPGLIRRTMFCATTQDIGFPCSGEWGAPLVCNRTTLVGLASWGISCGIEAFPVVFTEVNHFVGWIENHVDSFKRTSGLS